MVSVVTASDRHCYLEPLADMHRDRKRVFVDRLGWDVATVDGQYEIDEFDTDEAIYLIVLDDSGRGHLGSVRLLPTTRPHLLSRVFSHLCADGVPTGEDVWEITRLCTRPGLEDSRSVRCKLMLALIEYALLRQIHRYTCVTHLPYLSRLLAVGWDCEPLGMPAQHGGGLVGALAINITAATPSLVNVAADIGQPVLRWSAQAAA